MSTIDTIDIHDEVNRLSDIDDVERLTAKEVIDLFAYFVNNDKLPEVVKGLIKCKNDKYKLMFLRKMLTSEQPDAGQTVLILKWNSVLNALCFEIIVLFTRYFCNGN
ncbi:hypothetical protein RIR_jg9800.t2 [Rhizophagus irregularis DAOM 181602=DAOM 197198]|nr:hypothetical protein RIR_jg9800.t2 [Rhizophagus irregularis DAOM 181602=DAOM 197198]